MKGLITILLCSTALFISCSKETIRGGGAINTETRALPVFTNIELGGSGDAVINYGTGYNVTLTGYQNLLPVYETNVVGNTLYMRFKADVYNVRNNNIKAVVTLPGLAGMRINGSGKMEAKNFVAANLTASINGSGYIFIGSSQYNTASYSINGSGEISAGTTEVAEVNAHISGSGNIELKVNTKLKATIAGSGIITYQGTPVALETQISGSGKIIKK